LQHPEIYHKFSWKIGSNGNMFDMTFARYAVRVAVSASSKLTPGLCWKNTSKIVKTTILESYNSVGTFDFANFKQHSVII